MFSLLYGLYEYLFRKAEFRLLIVGVDKAGKTTLLEQVKRAWTDAEGLPPSQILPTVGLNIGRVEAFGSKLVFWDLGGQVGLRSIWEKYYAEAHAVIFVVDAAAPHRFDDAKDALHRALGNKELEGAPVLVVANKADLGEAVMVSEITPALDVQRLGSRARKVLAGSALTGDGLQEGITWIVEAVKRSPRTQRLTEQL